MLVYFISNDPTLLQLSEHLNSSQTKSHIFVFSDILLITISPIRMSEVSVSYSGVLVDSNVNFFFRRWLNKDLVPLPGCVTANTHSYTHTTHT